MGLLVCSCDDKQVVLGINVLLSSGYSELTNIKFHSFEELKHCLEAIHLALKAYSAFHMAKRIISVTKEVLHLSVLFAALLLQDAGVRRHSERSQNLLLQKGVEFKCKNFSKQHFIFRV